MGYRHLEAHGRSRLVTRAHRRGHDQGTPRAHAEERESTRIDPELGRVVGQPTQHRVAVVELGRVGVLRSESVAHRDHHRRDRLAEHRGDGVLVLDAPEDHPTAMDEHDPR